MKPTEPLKVRPFFFVPFTSIQIYQQPFVLTLLTHNKHTGKREMNEEDCATLRRKKKTEGSSSSCSRHTQTEGRMRRSYKLWVLAAVLILAIWSLFTGTITLKWSSYSGHLNPFSDDLINSSLLDDLDVLEIEEREKVVKHMWDVYTHSRWIRLPKFWIEAFEAAYEELISDDSGVRGSAVSEIAKMSLQRYIDLEPPPPFQNVRGGGGGQETIKNQRKEDDKKKIAS